MKRLLCIWLPNWPIQCVHHRDRLHGPLLPSNVEGPRSDGNPKQSNDLETARPPEVGERGLLPSDSTRFPPTVLWRDDPRRGRVVAAPCRHAAAVGVRFEMPLVEAVELLDRIGPKIKIGPEIKTAPQGGVLVQPHDVLVQPHDVSLDREALSRLAERLQAEVSPLVALEPLDAQPWAGQRLHQPDSLLCDISGVSHLFGGEAGLLRAAESLLANLGLFSQMAIADTVGAAWGWAHGPQNGNRGREAGCLLPIGELPQGLDPLPIEALRIDVTTAATLRRLGVETIGALRRFPRGGLAARLGPRLLKRMAQAFGEVDEPLAFYHPQPENRHRLELEYPSDDLVILKNRLEHLVACVCRQLSEGQRGALRVECRLESADHEPCLFHVGLFSPTADADHLGRLLMDRLESKRLPAPITSLTLAVTLAGPLRRTQTSLFPHGMQANVEVDASQQLAIGRLLDTLSGRLGRDAVLGVRLRKTPLPEEAFAPFPLTGRPRPRRRRQAVPSSPGSRGPSSQGLHGSSPSATDSEGQHPAAAPPTTDAPTTDGPANGAPATDAPANGALATAAPSTDDPLRRPLTLLRQPLRLTAVGGSGTPADRADGCPNRFRLGRQIDHIVRAWGPERIETGWWQGSPVRRDYFRVLTSRGECWWIFRELAARELAASEPRGSRPKGPRSSEVWMLHGRFS